ncbi:hypothetical protein CapIbe_011002 [Capra ibex]
MNTQGRGDELDGRKCYRRRLCRISQSWKMLKKMIGRTKQKLLTRLHRYHHYLNGAISLRHGSYKFVTSLPNF